MNINIYNPYVRKELELYHHGIEGQKWGKRNGPPYPLSKEDYSAAEKKAKGYKKQLNHLAAGRSTASYNSLENAYKADKVNAKLKKEISKHGENSKKAKELQDEFDFLNSKTKESFAEINRIDKEIKRISDQLDDEGFELWTAKYSTNAHLGENIALELLTGMVLGRGKSAWYENMAFDVTADPEKIYKAQKERNGK